MSSGPVVLDSVRTVRKGWVLAEGDGHLWLLTGETAKMEGIRGGMTVDPVEMDRLAAADQFPAARSDAGRYVSRTEHTSAQMKDYLRRRKYLPQVVEEVSSWAVESGLISDRRYTEVFVSSHTDRSPMGNYRLKMELRRRGVDESTVSQVLGERDEEELFELLLEEVRTRYAGLERERALRRASGYLMRRGFGFDLVRRVLDEAIGDGGDD